MKAKFFPAQRRKSLPQCKAIAMAIAISGCAVGPDYQRPALPLPRTWSAPLPHQGDTGTLRDWWARWSDPILTDLIDSAQRENASVTIAAARIAQARAAVTAAASPFWPNISGNANANRSKGRSGAGSADGSQESSGSSAGNEITRTRSASVDAAWELDLFGGARRAKEAAIARADARSLDWHDARISVAAEVATSYANLRACEILVAGYEVDLKSRTETARLTDLKTKAGFSAPADAALSNASAAEAAARLTQQRADCDVEIKSLSMMTVIAEPQLREKLAASRAIFPKSAALVIDRVPAAALSQRPDLASSERELAAASSEIGVAAADRLPRISLTGSIGYSSSNFGAGDISGRTWSYGPAISLPIFDAGRRAANADAAKARYDEALANYKGRTATAVKEVEEALVRIVSAINRETDASNALKGYQAFLAAAEAKLRAGAGSQVELEEARRSVVAAQGVAVGVTRERLISLISLYRAVGGGWNAETAVVAPITARK
jgi:NodT family efflux transporter outer membrane factor (OMF) lipoprotein